MRHEIPRSGPVPAVQRAAVDFRVGDVVVEEKDCLFEITAINRFGTDTIEFCTQQVRNRAYHHDIFIVDTAVLWVVVPELFADAVITVRHAE